MNTKKSLFIIDGSSFLYRAYYGVRPLHTSAGIAVHAVYGFCRMIKKIIDSYHPESLLLVWDSAGTTERHELYPEYKAHRQAPPSDLFTQKETIQEFAHILEIPQLFKKGIEADDLIYSAALDAQKWGQEVVIISSDKDLAQTLGDGITLFDPFKDTLIDQTAFETAMGFSLTKIIFYYSLVGDSSDNIPGAQGIGPKTARELLNLFESVADMYSNLDRIEKKSLKEKLISSQENVFLSEQLFTLRYYDMKLTKDSVRFDTANWSKCLRFFTTLGFTSLAKTIASEAPASGYTDPVKQNEREYILIQTEDQLIELCKELKRAGLCALDTETTGLKPLEDSLVGISLCMKPGTAYYIPCGHTTGEVQLTQEQIHRHLKPLLEDASCKKYLHNAQFDMLVLHHAGIALQGVLYDSMILAHLLGNEASRVGLKFLSEHFLGEQMTSFSHLMKTMGIATFADMPLDKALAYAAHDAHQTYLLTELFKEKAEGSSLLEYYRTIEHPLIPLLAECHQEGISLDTQILEELNEHATQSLSDIKETIKKHLPAENEDINLNSPQQLEYFLFTVLALKPIKKTKQKTGYSTDAEVLTELAKIHPVPGLIIRYRELAKLKSTYIEGLSDAISKQTGRVHTTFSQTNTATGRLSSQDPNLQNIPTSTMGLPLSIRSAFKAPAGELLISFDYSQIELRVLAHLSGDKELIAAFKAGEDIHIKTAALIFQVPLESVTPEQRQVGKKINFSIIYGLTAYGLSKDLNLSFKDAQHFIDRYFESYPSIKTWMDTILLFTRENGFTQTLWGRKRAIPAIYEKNRTLYEAASRMAINTAVQGTAAEIMKLGMIRVHTTIKELGLPARFVLQIHDEIVIAAPREKAAEIAVILSKELQSAASWETALEVKYSLGETWESLTK